MIHACSCVAGGKGPTLGNMLVSQGTWQELLDLLNEEGHFADILCQNPQVWHGHSLRPKFEEKVSARVIELIIARFGTDRLDVQVTEACDDILRKKLKLYMAPKKTKLGIESSAVRSYTPYLSQKILTVRSKSKDSGVLPCTHACTHACIHNVWCAEGTLVRQPVRHPAGGCDPTDA